jgi:hypothetical protein
MLKTKFGPTVTRGNKWLLDPKGASKYKEITLGHVVYNSGHRPITAEPGRLLQRPFDGPKFELRERRNLDVAVAISSYHR